MKLLISGFCIYSFFVICFSLVSCNSNRIYDEYKEIPDYIWGKDNLIPFKFEIMDTSMSYNFYINLRHTGFYQYRNIWVKIRTILPSGKVTEQLIELMLADPDGRWVGSGMGDIWDNCILTKEDIHFSEVGIYKFELQQYMRTDRLPFVMEVGIAVENSGN